MDYREKALEYARGILSRGLGRSMGAMIEYSCIECDQYSLESYDAIKHAADCEVGEAQKFIHDHEAPGT